MNNLYVQLDLSRGNMEVEILGGNLLAFLTNSSASFRLWKLALSRTIIVPFFIVGRRHFFSQVWNKSESV